MATPFLQMQFITLMTLCLVEERHLCIVAVPTASPELQLLQSFARLPCRGGEGSLQERYACQRSCLR